MRRVSFFVLCVVVLSLVGCQAPTPPPPLDTTMEDIAAIEEATASFAAFFNAGDASGLAGLYAPDAVLYPPNAPVVQGREAIEGLWTDFLAGGLKIELAIEETDVDGDLGYKIGTYSLTTPEGEVADEGHWMEVWIRTDEGWFSARDIWNSDLPLEAAE